MPVVAVTSRNADGTPVLKEGEQVLASQPNVSLYFLPQTSEGSGVIYVTTMYVPSPHHTVRSRPLALLYFLWKSHSIILIFIFLHLLLNTPICLLLPITRKQYAC
jgi:hypothetical protein